MSFNIVLMNNTDPTNKVTKSPSTVSTLTGTLKDSSSIIDPVILIQRDSPVGFNYCYIQTFNRYYFVNDIIIVKNGLLEIHCHVDVLMSFKTEILAQRALVSRNAKNWNLYINDNNFLSYSNTKLVTKKFTVGFGGSSYILATMNGV